MSKIQVIRGLMLKNYLLYKHDKKYFFVTVMAPLIFTFLITFTLVMQNNMTGSTTIIDSSNVRSMFPLSYIDRQYSTSTPGSPFSQQNPSLPNFDRSKPLNQIVYTTSKNLTVNAEEFVRSVLEKVKKEDIIYPMKPIISFNSVEEMDAYLLKWTSDAVLVGVVFNHVDLEDNLFNYTLMYNGTNDRTLPQFSNVLNNALADLSVLEDDTDTFSVPLMYLQEIPIATDQDVFFVDSVIYSLTLGITFMIPLFTQTVVTEVEKELKHQLFISGVSPTMYWASRFFCDYLVYAIVAITQYVCLAVIGKAPAFISNSPILPLVFYALYGFNMLSFSYLFSFVFKKSEDAAKWAGGFVSLSITLIFIVVKFVLKFRIPVWMNIFLCLFPSYSFFYGLAVFGFAAMKDEPISILSLIRFQQYGAQMATILGILLFQSLLFIGFMGLMEYLRIKRKTPMSFFRSEEKLLQQVESMESNEEEDEDVAAERERMMSEDGDDDILRVLDVHKVYREKNKRVKHAVNGVYLGVKQGTCLGLLGPNGAGKTSIINVISGVTAASRGEVFINNYNIIKDPNNAYRSLGVCAQIDRLWEKLTAREHIRVFSIIRGVYSSEYVQRVLNEFQMEDIADQESKTLSGGQKRKLCVALAFIGEPSVVILDEPSSGMDVSTRRLLWNKILALREDRVIILTSHSMEEIDALCSNIGIMVNGRLRCLGSSQHLKSRFGAGYRLSLSTELTERTREWMDTSFPDAKLLNAVAHMQHYEVPKTPTTTLSYMFEQLEQNKEELQVTDYSISEATLEQVFLSFASMQA